MPAISLEQISKSYGEGAGLAGAGLVIPRLDLKIPEGQFVAFLGPSGCGKSTILRMIASLEAPDTGRVKIGGEDGVRGSHGENTRVSFVFQDPHLLPWRSAIENVRLPLELERTSGDHTELSRQALERVGLGGALDKMPHQLSGGMKMRVSIARALVTQPHILLMDEPFSALDEVTRFRLQEDLRMFWKASRMTVVFVTHSMSEAAFLAERQIVLSQRPARILVDRVSSLGDERDEHTRASLAYAQEVRELQLRFREGEEGAS
ncbi:MAG: ABC transporter ATP-binding protein [Bdellovibrionales bacterium]|jgi:NitT/TauT family transport system ATP-binding protein|nr:ABC transporter ATP-binding protein [Bdellovibrionales bacterium]